MGLPHDNAILCDSGGVVYQGREKGMNQWKSAHAANTKARSLEEAMEGADLFFGLSVAGAVTKKMVKSMADKPILFAMANPDPEITPEEVKAVRSDAIVATGRSDYPNQVNNVLGFPYIFRGALDVRARTVNDEMKIACAHALAELARLEVPDEVNAVYADTDLKYGPEYIIPVPFDPRLIEFVPPRIAQAAMDTGVARKPIANMEAYQSELAQRLDPTAASIHGIFEAVRQNPRRVVFAEGESERAIRAAIAFQNAGLGKPIPDRPRRRCARAHRRVGSPRGRQRRGPQRVASQGPQRNISSSCTTGCSAKACCFATASAWSIKTATSSPPA